MRLYGGVGPSNGYVQFCQDRRWVGVCSNGWGTNNASVVCNQLNFNSQGIVIYCIKNSIIIVQSYSSIIDSLVINGPDGESDTEYRFEASCAGSEGHISECTHRILPTDSCSSGAAISCGKSSSETTTTP